jgi:SAM-dependent methyltransferase
MAVPVEKRLWSVRDYIRKHQDARKLGIGRRDLVVDVGSGQNPHPRANVLCDRFVEDNTERAASGALRVDRALVVADATQTPFRDRSFDFAFCSHLLEHVDQPALLLSELQRIARAGYIETPSPIAEKIHGWPFHRWLVRVEGERLVIEAKTKAIFDADLHEWFGRQLQAPSFWRAFIPRLLERRMITVHHWRERIAFEGGRRGHRRPCIRARHGRSRGARLG